MKPSHAKKLVDHELRQTKQHLSEEIANTEEAEAQLHADANKIYPVEKEAEKEHHHKKASKRTTPGKIAFYESTPQHTKQPKFNQTRFHK